MKLMIARGFAVKHIRHLSFSTSMYMNEPDSISANTYSYSVLTGSRAYLH